MAIYWRTIGWLLLFGQKDRGDCVEDVELEVIVVPDFEHETKAPSMPRYHVSLHNMVDNDQSRNIKWATKYN